MEAKKGVIIQAQTPIVPGWQTKKLADCFGQALEGDSGLP